MTTSLRYLITTDNTDSNEEQNSFSNVSPFYSAAFYSIRASHQRIPPIALY